MVRHQAVQKPDHQPFIWINWNSCNCYFKSYWCNIVEAFVYVVQRDAGTLEDLCTPPLLMNFFGWRTKYFRLNLSVVFILAASLQRKTFSLTSWDQTREDVLGVKKDGRVIYRFLMSQERGIREGALHHTNHSPSFWWLESEETRRKRKKGGYYLDHLHLLTLRLHWVFQVSSNRTELTWGRLVSQKLW